MDIQYITDTDTLSFLPLRQWYISIVKDPNAPKPARSPHYFENLDIVTHTNTDLADELFSDYRKDLRPDLSIKRLLALYVDSPLQCTTRTLSREEQVINSRLSSYLNKLRLAKTEKKYKDQAIKDEHRFNNEMDNYRKNVPFPPTAQDIDFRCTIDLYHADIRSSGTGTRQPLDDSLPPKDGWYKSRYNGLGYLSLKPDDFDIYLDTNMSIGPRVYLTPADLPSLQEFEDSAYRAAYRLYYNVRRVVDKYQPTPTKILWGHEGSIILTGKEINDELSRNRALESIINSKETRNI